MKTKDQTTKGSRISCSAKVSPKYGVIKVGIDWHAHQYRVARIIDNAAPEPAQRFTPAEFLKWIQHQQRLAAEVHTCYEAGAGGFVLHRQLTQLGVKNLVITPYKLDQAQKRVQTDSTDARQLVQDLDRYVRGNQKALRVAHVPTPKQEDERAETRQREQLREHRLSMATQGRMLLLNRGIAVSNQWWQAKQWAKLQKQLSPFLLEMLERFRDLIQVLDEQVRKLQRKIEKSAPALRPKGLGALSFEEVRREVCDFDRFKNRKAPGSYAGLTGGVSSTNENYRDLPITKAGNRRLRVTLVETAWRLIHYQPQSKLLQRWKHVLLNPDTHRRARKRAIVAVARQFLVDLWRWQTGRVTPEQLGWVMTATAR